MTDAPDSPRPWRGSGAGSNTIYDARDLWIGHVRSAAEVAFIIRAVNNYDKMREALEKFQPSETFNDAYADDHLVYMRLGNLRLARTILKEIDNG